MSAELAARVEAATGPDRKLDREIAEVHIRGILQRLGESAACEIAAAMSAARLDADLDAYTASLDAAMSLIPQDPHGDWWQLTGACQANLRAGWQVYLSRWDCRELDEEVDNTALYVADEQRPSTVSGTARTFALALTAAALRARLTKEDG